MSAIFDSSSGNDEPGVRRARSCDRDKVALGENGEFKNGVKLIDVSWLVGNLYLNDADKERLIQARRKK